MFVLRNTLLAVSAVLDMALDFYVLVLIVRVVISWVSPDPYNPIVQFLYSVTEPVLSRARRFMYGTLRVPMSGIDFSPLLVIFLVYFIKLALVASLRDLALSFG